MKLAYSIGFIALAVMAAPAIAQFHYQAATTDFAWNGDIWGPEVGHYAAEEFIQRMRMEMNLSFMELDNSNALLADAGIENPYYADPRQLYEILWNKNVRLFFSGTVEKIVQTGDVDGSAEVKIAITVRVVDIGAPAHITDERVEYKVRIEKKIPEDEQMSAEEASSLFRSMGTRLASQLAEDIAYYYRYRRY